MSTKKSPFIVLVSCLAFLFCALPVQPAFPQQTAAPALDEPEVNRVPLPAIKADDPSAAGREKADTAPKTRPHDSTDFLMDAGNPLQKDGDVTPPSISSRGTWKVTQTSAVVLWSTNEASDSTVELYNGTSWVRAANNPLLVTSHSVGISGLASGTSYQVRVKSKDAAGNETVSAPFGFKTLTSTPDTTAPQISGVSVSGTSTSATVLWTTNEPGDSALEIFDGAGWALKASNASLTTSHSLTSAGLAADTPYQMRVRSRDGAGNETISAALDFRTQPAVGGGDTTPPAITSRGAGNITATSAVVLWGTNETSSSVVEVLKGTVWTAAANNPQLVTSHSVRLSGLTPSTLYQIRVRSKDAAGNETVSTPFSFTTLTPPDTTPPVISAVTSSAQGSTGAAVQWTTNEAGDSRLEIFDGAVWVVKASNASLTTSHSLTVGGLAAGTAYAMRVRSKDAAGNDTISEVFTVTTDTGAAAISFVSRSGGWTDAAGGAAAQVEGEYLIYSAGIPAQGDYLLKVQARNYPFSAGWHLPSGYTEFLVEVRVDDAVRGTLSIPASDTQFFEGRIALAGLSPGDHAVKLTWLNDGWNSAEHGDANILIGQVTIAVDTNPAARGPVLSGISVPDAGSSSAEIRWATDTAADSRVEYGVSPAYGGAASAAGLTTAHSLVLQNLRPQVTYHYRVISKDARGNETASPDFTFTTDPNYGLAAGATLFLDFDGTYLSTWGQYSNITVPAFDTDGDPSSFSSSEHAIMDQVLAAVVEKYSLFNVGVTLTDPFAASDPHYADPKAEFSARNAFYESGKVIQVAVGGSSSGVLGMSAAGGVAYVNTFTNSYANTVFVFPDNLAKAARYIWEAAAHEAAHAFGTHHQSVFDSSGAKTVEYNPGSNGVAPIMGNSYDKRGIWWVGTSDTSTTIQDDIAVISRAANGFGFRADEYGDTPANAAAFPETFGTAFGAYGVINSASDADLFRFTLTESGGVTFNASVAPYGAMLDLKLQILDGSGNVITTQDSASLGESISHFNLPAGTYYLAVKSHGAYKGDAGQYWIEGSVPPGAMTS